MLALGLSPRVRGNHVAITNKGVVLGTIPARAGEPASDTFVFAAIKDYPRACGGT